nr:enoyl-CoA hydratase-related protein [Nocardioides alcanivorans]
MTVRSERVGAVGVITLDRPEKRNALNATMIDGIVHAVEHHEADPAVRVIVLTGTGDRAFCAGMDLNRVAGDPSPAVEPVETTPPPAVEPVETTPPPPDRPETAGYKRLIVEGSSKPLIAAINGAAVAGGFELMLACDLAVAADHARFGLPEVSRGLVAGGGGTLLPLRIPRAVAFELALTGEAITAARAHELGLVNHVVPGTEVLSRAMQLAEVIAGNSPHAVRLTRRMLREASDLPIEEAWHRADEAIADVLASADAQEGSRAFLERRSPAGPDLVREVADPARPVCGAFLEGRTHAFAYVVVSHEHLVPVRLQPLDLVGIACQRRPQGLLARREREGPAASISRARARVAGSTSSAGSAWLHRPQASARRPSKRRPVNRISAARETPTRRGSTQCT